jgi:hypothetical protein
MSKKFHMCGHCDKALEDAESAKFHDSMCLLNPKNYMLQTETTDNKNTQTDSQTKQLFTIDDKSERKLNYSKYTDIFW